MDQFRCSSMTIPTIILFIYMASPVMTASIEIHVFAKSVASQVSRSLIERTKNITNYHKIKEDLEGLVTTKEKLVGRDVIQEFQQNIEGIFREKSDALKNIKKTAEEEKRKHVEDEDMEKFDYFNMRSVQRDNKTSLRIHHPFSPKVFVNMTHSFVQIPTNIYAYKPQILNTVKWTEKLDVTFKENYFNQSKETLLYQYYGDKSGLLRLYPGNKFGEEDSQVDLFDCRRRVWYIQASASPKDVVILIDLSGSMKGSNIGIARIATASLIETLSENDYFNVITINEVVSYVKPCAKHLIQATKLNKEAMKLALQNLGKPELTAQPTLGIEEAFKILNSGPGDNRTTASCNQAIMFISDGIEGENIAEDVFKKYSPNKTVRAFSFFVGRTHVNVGQKALLKMACDNRGYFYPIETVGNVWDTVLEYLQVMSRPMNVSRDNSTVTYTPMYLDGGGMGMIMSISMGIFDDNGLIGVTGTDITLLSLLEQLPVSIFGPFSYIFIINNNGFLIMHPKLKKQSGYLTAPRNVFLEDLVRGVFRNKSMALKRNMINHKKHGEMSFPMYWVYDNDQRCAHIQAKVFYEPIEETEFSAGVVLANNEITYVKYSDEAANEWLMYGIDALETPVGGEGYQKVSIAQWEYCDKPYDKTTSKSVKNYYTIAELKSHLNDLKYDEIGDLPNNCNRDLLKKLLVTAGIVSRRVNQSWDPNVLKNKLYDGVFVSTNGGYVKYFSYSKHYPRDQKEFLKPPHFEMAAANPTATVSVAAPYVDADRYVSRQHYFEVTAAVKIGKEKILTAVSGVRIRSNFFREILENATSIEPKTYCALNDTHICALIDQNGYIIASNQGDEFTGRFIGEISGVLIRKLAEVGIFKKIQLDDTQAVCDQQEFEKSASNILLTPFKVMYHGATVFLNTLSWFALEYVAFLVWPSDAKISRKREVKPPIQVSCTMTMPFYVYQEETFRKLHSDTHKEANCNAACNLIYYLNPVEESNLLFLMAKSTKQCRRVCTQLHEKLRHTRNSTDIENRICKMEQRYRRPPSSCFNDVIEEKNFTCGRAGLVNPSVWLLGILSCIYYVI